MRQARGAAKEPRPSRKRRRRRHPGFGGRAALGRPATRWRSAARRARAAVIGLISIWFLAFVLLDGVEIGGPSQELRYGVEQMVEHSAAGLARG